MPQVDFNTFILIILPFILLLLTLFNFIGFFFIILANFQKKNENMNSLIHFVPNINKKINIINLDQEQEFLAKNK